MSRSAYSFATLETYIGERFGPSPAVLIDQARIDAFAAVTEDPQWIHVDQAGAAGTPFGGKIGVSTRSERAKCNLFESLPSAHR